MKVDWAEAVRVSIDFKNDRPWLLLDPDIWIWPARAERADGSRRSLSRELRPRTVKLDLNATRLWIEFHDHVERLLAPEAPLSSIKHLANKAPEHAARLAVTIEAFDTLNVETVSAKAMMGGIELVQHYLSEALRIYAAIEDSPDLRLAEKALDWIRSRPKGIFTTRDLYQSGPYAIRDSAKAKVIIIILVEHRWIVQIEGGAIIDGVKRREVFELSPEARAK